MDCDVAVETQDAFVRERGDVAHGNQDERGGRNETHGTHRDHLPVWQVQT